MSRYLLPLLLALCLLLTGCAPLLERTYRTSEPHSSRFWESEAADTLRAENYQDIVNDLLILIGQHTESATLRLYRFGDDLTAALEQASSEVQQETPLGAYAVEYITTTGQAQGGYYEATVQIGYRRTAEQIQALVSATTPEAVYSLLETALDEGKPELAVRISYWGQNGQERIETAVELLWETHGLPGAPEIYYYPAEGQAGLVEFILTTQEPADPADPEPEAPEQAET